MRNLLTVQLPNIAITVIVLDSEHNTHYRYANYGKGELQKSMFDTLTFSS